MGYGCIGQNTYRNGNYDPMRNGDLMVVIMVIIIWLVVTGTMGILNDFPETVGNGMSPSQLTNSLHDFSEG
jgi:hypothetical protein